MNIKKIVLRTVPYVCIALYGTKIGQAWRLAAGTAFAEKFLHWGDGFMQALASPLPSFHPQDVLAGMAIAAAFYAAVYVKGKNAKKFRHNVEYGSARWGTAKDRQPAQLRHAEAGLQGPVQDARQQRRPVSDDAVQRTGREHQVCPLVGIHQGGDARRDHRYAQGRGVQMPGVSGIRRVQACVGKLDGAAQPGSLRTAKAVHTDQGCGPHCIDHGRRQLPQGQPGVPGHAGGQCRHRPDAPHRQGMLRPHGSSLIHTPVVFFILA